VHTGAIGVKYPNHFYLNLVLPVIIEKKSFRTTLAFVVTGTDADRVHVPPITFYLGVYSGIAIDFAG
jgi:hypothetical protein